MKAIMHIQIVNGDDKGAAMSSITIPYESGMDVRLTVGNALIQLLGVTLEKAMALAKGITTCQQ